MLRQEYPRPNFVRDNWLNLNGEWEFSFENNVFDMKIVVPFTYQSELSGINIKENHNKVWYRRKFQLPPTMCNKRIILHFGAVDYEADCYVNGHHVKNHLGGHISFDVEISEYLIEGFNELIVCAKDNVRDLEMPRGKQFWGEKPESIFYTNTTGIWQTVWIEAVNDTYLSNVYLTPNIDDFEVDVEYELEGNVDSQTTLFVEIIYEQNIVVSSSFSNICNNGKFSINLLQGYLKYNNFYEQMMWTPENPKLFDIKFKIEKNNIISDEVSSYFGMRKVSINDGIFMLNNKPYYQKLVLDQGYWPKSLLTAPQDEDFVNDIMLSKSMGFNGARKHQKIEDPRYLYWADKIGFLVWGEICASFAYSKKSVTRLTNEWVETICRDYNHPSIVVWTPLNESWGIPNVLTSEKEQNHSLAMVSLTKSIDNTRPVISNDGWEHTNSDLFTIHDYCSQKEVLLKRYSKSENIENQLPCGRKLLSNGYKYSGQPILVTEFGGISYEIESDIDIGWGYTKVKTNEEFANSIYNVTSALLESPIIQGYCYTQLTDVEQETNGLLTYDRKPKIDLNIIKKINDNNWK